MRTTDLHFVYLRNAVEMKRRIDNSLHRQCLGLLFEVDIMDLHG